MIEDLRTGTNELIAGWGAELLRHCERFVRPLIAADDGRRPRHVGSGVLVAFNDRSFFLTAAHVLRDALGHPWAIAGEQNLVPPQSAVYFTTPAEAHQHDTADVGFVELTPNEVHQLGDVEFLSPARPDPDERRRPPQPGLTRPFYFVFGYPASRMKANPQTKTVRATGAFPLLSVPVERYVYTAINRPEHAHLIVAFDRGDSHGRKGAVVAPHPRGISGGGIWRVDDLVHLKPEATRLVAIATEWWAQQEALVGTRIGVVLDGLRARYPDLQAFIPPTEG